MSKISKVAQRFLNLTTYENEKNVAKISIRAPDFKSFQKLQISKNGKKIGGSGWKLHCC